MQQGDFKSIDPDAVKGKRIGRLRSGERWYLARENSFGNPLNRASIEDIIIYLEEVTGNNERIDFKGYISTFKAGKIPAAGCCAFRIYARFIVFRFCPRVLRNAADNDNRLMTKGQNGINMQLQCRIHARNIVTHKYDAGN
jgi:hypothetical protein